MRVLITAGPTREYFDTIRFISNPSSGKMGYSLAAAAAARGHEVTLISGPVSLEPPAGVAVVQVTSAAEMAAAARKHWPRQDVAIMTAAVCDYRPARQLSKKLAKSLEPMQLTLLPTEDIALALGESKRAGQVLIAFALEDHDGRAHAESKLQRKNCDAIVLNGPGNINRDKAEVTVLVRGGEWQGWRQGSKLQVASRLVRLAEGLVRDVAPHKRHTTRRSSQREETKRRGEGGKRRKGETTTARQGGDHHRGHEGK